MGGARERAIAGLPSAGPRDLAQAMDEGRKVEFGALYLGAPLVMALAMPPDWLWPVFLGVTVAAVVLLARGTSKPVPVAP